MDDDGENQDSEYIILGYVWCTFTSFDYIQILFLFLMTFKKSKASWTLLRWNFTGDRFNLMWTWPSCSPSWRWSTLTWTRCWRLGLSIGLSSCALLRSKTNRRRASALEALDRVASLVPSYWRKINTKVPKLDQSGKSDAFTWATSHHKQSRGWLQVNILAKNDASWLVAKTPMLRCHPLGGSTARRLYVPVGSSVTRFNLATSKSLLRFMLLLLFSLHQKWFSRFSGLLDFPKHQLQKTGG